MEDIRVLRNELIETRRLVLIQLRTVYYVDYDEKKYSAKEILLRKNRHGKVFCFPEDAEKGFEHFRERLIWKVPK